MLRRLLEHAETRRLLRDGAWVAVLVALLWSPLPEIILGRWLQVSNDVRPETGRAHDRLDLLQESDSQAVSRSTELEQQAEESARVATLSQLRIYLMNHTELDMGLGRFREFYGSLSSWQQDQLIAPAALEDLSRRGLRAVTVNRHGVHARFSFLDESRNRMDGTEVDLLQIQLLPLGLGQVAEQDTGLALADPALTEVRDRQEESALVPEHRELLSRLRQVPGLSVRRVWQAQGEILLLEFMAGGETQWLRPGGVVVSKDTGLPIRSGGEERE